MTAGQDGVDTHSWAAPGSWTQQRWWELPNSCPVRCKAEGRGVLPQVAGRAVGTWQRMCFSCQLEESQRCRSTRMGGDLAPRSSSCQWRLQTGSEDYFFCTLVSMADKCISFYTTLPFPFIYLPLWLFSVLGIWTQVLVYARQSLEFWATLKAFSFSFQKLKGQHHLSDYIA